LFYNYFVFIFVEYKIYIMKLTPRKQIEKLMESADEGDFYSTSNQFISLIENRISIETKEIMKQLNDGFLWTNERLVFNKIYNFLMDGKSIKNIKSELRRI